MILTNITRNPDELTQEVWEFLIGTSYRNVRIMCDRYYKGVRQPTRHRKYEVQLQYNRLRARENIGNAEGETPIIPANVLQEVKDKLIAGIEFEIDGFKKED